MRGEAFHGVMERLRHRVFVRSGTQTRSAGWTQIAAGAPKTITLCHCAFTMTEIVCGATAKFVFGSFLQFSHNADMGKPSPS